MKSTFLLIIFIFLFSTLFPCPVTAVQKINLQSGDFYIGTIVEENDDFIYIQTAFGKMEIDRTTIISIEYVQDEEPEVEDSYGLDDLSDSSTDDIFPENTEPITDLNFYKSQVKMLETRMDLYQKNIDLLEQELEDTKKKVLRQTESYKEEIANLKKQLEKKEASAESQFDNLISIEPSKEVYINKSYIKKIKFIVSEGIDGFFIRAEYTIYSEIVSVEPNFEVYFFSENGLNIALDKNNLQFTRIPRGHQHVITKGIPLTFPELYPKFYFIKFKEE